LPPAPQNNSTSICENQAGYGETGSKFSKINYLEREARNTSLGAAGEKFILEYEKTRLMSIYKAGYDFKRLFTISEYYDRDRPTFYRKIQSVRENDMDMTGWLYYFITGLETQMIEVKECGEQVIRRDVLT